MLDGKDSVTNELILFFLMKILSGFNLFWQELNKQEFTSLTSSLNLALFIKYCKLSK